MNVPVDQTWATMEALKNNQQCPAVEVRSQSEDSLVSALTELAEDAQGRGWPVVFIHESSMADLEALTGRGDPAYVAIVPRASVADRKRFEWLVRMSRSRGGYVVVGVLMTDEQVGWLDRQSLTVIEVV